jgi:hypothetical protein
MNNNFICVECGEFIDSLYIEYSARNIRLTRCPKCSKVADKYVEYELTLVLIDIALLRTPAFRHILYNRMSMNYIMQNVGWLVPAIIVMNMTLKLMVLRNSTYKQLDWYNVLHAAISSALEHVSVTIAVITGVWFMPQSKSLQLRSSWASTLRIYLSIALPELLRATAIVLQLFDTEPSLRLLLGALLLAVQAVSFQTTYLISDRSSSNSKYPLLVLCSMAAIVSRVLVKLFFYSLSDIWLVGIF